MIIKSNSVPEYSLTTGEGFEKPKNGAAYIKKEIWESLLADYAKVEKNGEKAIVKLGDFTFLFAYDEESEQNVLFVDGYLVTDIKADKKEIKVFTTNSNVPYKKIAEKDLVTTFMADLDSAIASKEALEKAKEEVVAYFNIQKDEEPGIMQAQYEIDARNNKIAELRKIIDEDNQKAIVEKEKKLTNLLKDTNAKFKDIKALRSEIEALKKENQNHEKEINEIQKELVGQIAVLRNKIENCKIKIEEENKKAEKDRDKKVIQKATKEIAEYEKQINTLRQTQVIEDLNKQISELEGKKKTNNSEIATAEDRIKELKRRTDERSSGKKVESDGSLKTKAEYEKVIKNLTAENESIDAQIAALKNKVEIAKQIAASNNGLEVQLEARKIALEKKLKEAATSELALAEIKKIEQADYSQFLAAPAGVENETVEDKIRRVEAAKVEAATSSFTTKLTAAEKLIGEKREALRKYEAGNVYVRAQEVFAQPKYEQLYDAINGLTPVYWGINISLQDEPGYGCIVVGPKLNEDKKVTGISKDTLNRTMYIVVGKTIDEVRNSLPASAEDFLNIEGAKVYAADNITSKRDYTKAYAEVYKNTEILKDADGNPVLDENGRKQFVPSGKKVKIKLDIRTEAKIDKFNNKQQKKGKKAEKRVVDFTTPETLEKVCITLGSKECLDTEKPSYWKYDYTKKTFAPLVKKGAVVALVLGAAAVSAAGGYHVYQQAKTNEGQQELLDDQKLAFETEEAIKFGKEQCGNNAFKYEYDKNGNVVMGEVVCADLTKDVETYKQEGRSNNDVYENYTKDGYVAQYVYNTTMELGKQGNILKIDGNSLFDDYFKNIEFTTYTSDTENYPKDALGNVLTAHQKDLARDAYEEAVAELLKADEKVSESSAINPFNEVIIDAAQSKVNKDLKGTKKTMVVKGVYIDFNADTAFAVANEGESEGKYIVKITYADDIKTLDDAVVYMTNADSSYYTCAAANLNFPGTAYQDYYVSNDTTHNGNVYSKNFIKAERDGVKYTFTEFKGYDVLNTNTEKMPSSNNIAYLSLAGSAAYAIDGLEIVGDMVEKTEYTSEIPEDVSTNSYGQIFGYQKEGKTK